LQNTACNREQEVRVTVGTTGEFGLIARVTPRLNTGAPAVLLGPGDDAALVAAPDRRVAASTDVLVEGRHFRRDWSTGRDVGHRAAAANLADIAAMGGRPTALLVGLCTPPDLEITWVEELADGLAAEAALTGATVVGGDISASPTLTIAVTVLGDLEEKPAVVRSGARPGDTVAICGRLGYAAAGYTVLSRGFRSPKLLVEAYRRPEVPYAAGPEAARLGATSMIDVSDGLIADLGHVATASGVGIDLHKAAFTVPGAMRDAATALGVDPHAWILAGGDDHALAATFAPDVALPAHWTVVGEVLQASLFAAGDGVTVDGRRYAGPAGWDHFR
jgi:thiamine-monophosphate kinase